MTTESLQRLLSLAGRSVERPQLGLFSNDGWRPNDRVHTAGDLQLLRRKCVAVVGARAVSVGGAARAKRIAKDLVGAGVVVVSGLAKGVDTIALTSALAADDRVVGVIGTPLDKAYPNENAWLQERVHKKHLLVSPFDVGAVQQKHFFPMRNRVMAALSDATVIVEASDTSGTLHQAAECQRLGRWLFIMKSVVENPEVSWPALFLGRR